MRIIIDFDPTAAPGAQPSVAVVRPTAAEGANVTLESQAVAVDAGAFAGIPVGEGIASTPQPRTNGYARGLGAPPPPHGDTFGLTPEIGRESTRGNAGGFRG
jgi:hypothetical protein